MPDVSTFEAELFVKNDNRVAARISVQPGGTALDGATVTLDLLEEDDAEVIPQQVMDEEGDVVITLGGETLTARLYSTVIDKTAPLVAGQAYQIIVTATHASGYDARWSKREVAKERKG